MGKKVLALVSLFAILTVNWAIAQTKTIKGRVIASDTNEPLPGATVSVKGTTNGTITDMDGNYSINVGNDATTLVIQFIGFKMQEQEISGRSEINVTLEVDALNLNEVVVTALGVSREKKALGYATQEVKGDAISEAKEVNVVNSLAGRVAGVQVSSATGNMGGSSRILIRGANSVTGNNQPLFVVDGVPLDNSSFTGIDAASGANLERGAGGYDYGNAIQDLNPEDIESINVLKGPSASALYGSRGSNGVIVITTKKGAAGKKKGLGVSYKFGMNFDNAYILPTYQNSYGGGFAFDTLWYSQNPEMFPSGSGTYSANGDSYDLMPNYAVDESWGPKLDGTTQYRPFWSLDPEDPSTFGQTALWRANPDNVKEFFNTGVTMTHNVTLQAATKENSFRLSYTNLNQTFIYPGSELDRNTLSFNGTQKLSDKFEASIGVNYVNTKAQGRPGTGYDGNNVMQQFNQWGQRQWNNDEMYNYYLLPDGITQRTWNRTSFNNGTPKYTDNPYWTRLQNYQNDGRERMFGNLALNYKINDFLSIRGRYMTDFYTDIRNERIAVGSQAESYYSTVERFVKEDNMDLTLNFQKALTSDIELNAFAGTNVMKRGFRAIGGETVGGLNAPGWYDLNNSKSPAKTFDNSSAKQINSVFASASFGYKRMAYLDLTARNDWSSTLPAENRSYFYPSATASFIFTEMSAFENIKWFSFGKIRAGWASVGSDTDPYRLNVVYSPNDGFAGNPNLTVPNALNNANLRPEITNSWEVGADLRFFDGRLNLDATYYNSITTDQIIPLAISSATGYTSAYINAGRMGNKGFEAVLSGTPVKMKNGFQWDIAFNISRNRNRVIELYSDVENGVQVDNIRLANAPFSASVNAYVDQPYGMLRGYGFQRDANGNKLVDADGYYIRSEELMNLGSVLADYTGGITNTFSYKGISLRALVDFQIGGKVFSTTNMWGKYSGIIEETVTGTPDGVIANGGTDIREDGFIVNGVYAPGTVIDGADVSGQPNESVIPAELHFFYNQGYVITEADVYDAGYWYLRELSLNFNVPKKVYEKLGVSNAKVGLTGRNVLLLHSNVPHLDPTSLTTSATNVQGLEGAATPSVRSIGFTVSFNF